MEQLLRKKVLRALLILLGLYLIFTTLIEVINAEVEARLANASERRPEMIATSTPEFPQQFNTETIRILNTF